MNMKKLILTLSICLTGYFAYASNSTFMVTNSDATRLNARPGTISLQVKIDNLNFRRTTRFSGRSNIIRKLQKNEILEVVENYARYYKVRTNQRIVNNRLVYEEGYVWKNDRYLQNLNPTATEVNNPGVPNATHEGNFHTSTGELTLPLCGCTHSKCRITSSYGRRWGKMHSGLDLAGPRGTPIHAVADGVISSSSCGKGYGICFKINHQSTLKDNKQRTISTRGFQTKYAHMSRRAVRAGQRVHKGQIIGYVGSTGHSTGNHLHLEFRANGNRYNPTRFFPERTLDKKDRYPSCPTDGSNGNRTGITR